MKRIALATALIACGACGDRRTDSREATESEAPAPAAAETTAGQRPADPAPEAPLLEPLGPALETQLRQPMTSASFEGFTEDGRRFALRAQHGVDAEELGGADLLELVQIHDALTGEMIASYRIDRAVDDERNASAQLARAWKEALPREQWRAFRQQHRLVGATGQLTSPDGSWTLRAESDGVAPYGSTFEVAAADDELTTRWTGFRDDPARIAQRRPTRAPLVRVVAARAERTYELLAIRPPWDYDAIDAARGDDAPSVEARISAHWSPAGDRLLLLVSHEAIGAHGEHGALVDVRFYVRALGPQLEIVDAGAGAGASHRAAALLGAHELPVARITTGDHPAGVFYRGEAHAELARGIAAILGEPRIEPTADRGWPAVTIALSR